MQTVAEFLAGQSGGSYIPPKGIQSVSDFLAKQPVTTPSPSWGETNFPATTKAVSGIILNPLSLPTPTEPKPLISPKSIGATSPNGEWQFRKDPVNGKVDWVANANPLGKMVESIKTSFMNEGQAAANFISSFGLDRPVSEKIGTGAKLLAQSGNLLFSPLTALFAGADQIPVLGTITKAIETGLTAVSEGVPKGTNAVIDAIPDSVLSKQSKENIKGGIGELASLVVILKGGELIGGDKLSELTKKYGAEDAKTIVDKATELAQEKPVETPVQKIETPTEYFKRQESSQSTISPDLQPLAAEARKYKSAEEFVRATTEKQKEMVVSLIKQSDEAFALSNEITGGKGRINNERNIGIGQELKAKAIREERKLLNTLSADKLTDFYNQATKGKDLVNVRTTASAADLSQKAASDGFDSLPETQKAKYTPTTKAETINAVDEIMKDMEQARKMVRGETPVPSGAIGQVLFNAMEKYALKNGDQSLINDLVKSPLSTQTSEVGQTLGAHGFNDNPHSPVEAIREITQARQKLVKGEVGKAVRDTVGEIKKSIRKSSSKKVTWESFIKDVTC